tara:strand:- start:136 stop:558 length:423 start_codon:yes stop_codon:yes gene_type:complete
LLAIGALNPIYAETRFICNGSNKSKLAKTAKICRFGWLSRKFLFLRGVLVPIYAYRCTDCGHAQDVLQKMSDSPLTDCPACGKATYAKQVTAAGFQLKGSGWYVTDFRNNGTKPASAAASSESSGSGSSTSGTSTSTPAA